MALFSDVIGAVGDNVQLLNDGETIGSVTAKLTPGHTPGHMSYQLRSGEKALFFTGDSSISRVRVCILLCHGILS